MCGRCVEATDKQVFDLSPIEGKTRAGINIHNIKTREKGIVDSFFEGRRRGKVILLSWQMCPDIANERVNLVNMRRAQQLIRVDLQPSAGGGGGGGGEGEGGGNG